MFFTTPNEGQDVYRRRLGGRLSQVVDLYDTKSAASDAAGVTPEQLNKWIKGTVKVPVEGLRLIALSANVDFSWLVTGQGEMLQAQVNNDQSKSISLAGLQRPDFVTLPIYNEIRASAGPGATVPTTEQADGVIAFSRTFLRDQGAIPERCSIIWARGTSMKPTIPDGSILVVDHSQSAVENGCIYVFNVCDRLLVKRARWRMDGRLELVSDNKDEDYPVETFGPSEADELRVVGRVVYFCRTP